MRTRAELYNSLLKLQAELSYASEITVLKKQIGINRSTY